MPNELGEQREKIAKDLAHRFKYHAPNAAQAETYGRLRDFGHGFAQMIVASVPEGRERALALTYLEQVVMWSNAGIARNA